MRLLEQQTVAPETLSNVANFSSSLQLSAVQEELEAMIQNVQQLAASADTPPTTPTQTQFSPMPQATETQLTPTPQTTETQFTPAPQTTETQFTPAPQTTETQFTPAPQATHFNVSQAQVCIIFLFII